MGGRAPCLDRVNNRGYLMRQKYLFLLVFLFTIVGAGFGRRATGSRGPCFLPVGCRREPRRLLPDERYAGRGIFFRCVQCKALDCSCLTWRKEECFGVEVLKR